MLEKLKEYLIENDYSYEDTLKWYYKKYSQFDNINITINEIISIHAYKGDIMKHFTVFTSKFTKEIFQEMVNEIKEYEGWMGK